MKNRIVYFAEKNKAVFGDCPLTEPKEGEILVKIAASAISSGTERALITGDPNCGLNSDGVTSSFPRYSGYSAAGTVVSVGVNVTDFKAGDRVALHWSDHAKYCTRPAKNAVRIPDNVPFEQAALAHIATFPLAALRKCRPEFGESTIIMGQGLLGQIAVVLAKSAGLCPVVAVDPVKARRDKAIALGADFSLDPFEPGFTEKAKAATNGGANVAVEVTGLGKGLDQLLDCMKRFGRVALLGCTRNSDFKIDYYRKVHGPGITLVGAHTAARPFVESSPNEWTTHDDMTAVMNLISHGRFDFAKVYERIASPLDAGRIYDELVNDRSFPVTLFDWNTVED